MFASTHTCILPFLQNYQTVWLDMENDHHTDTRILEHSTRISPFHQNLPLVPSTMYLSNCSPRCCFNGLSWKTSISNSSLCLMHIKHAQPPLSVSQFLIQCKYAQSPMQTHAHTLHTVSLGTNSNLIFTGGIFTVGFYHQPIVPMIFSCHLSCLGMCWSQEQKRESGDGN